MDIEAFNPFEKIDETTDIREKILRNYRWVVAGVGALAILSGGAGLAVRGLDHEVNKQPPAPKLSGSPHERSEQVVRFYQSLDH
jgi:hypothetical protein